MSKFKKDDIVISPGGLSEFRILGIQEWEGSTYYWVARQNGRPRVHAEAAISDYRLKPQFFEVGDTWVASRYYYKVVQVAEDPLEAWVMATYLPTGEACRMTYDMDAYLEVKNKITKA